MHFDCVNGFSKFNQRNNMANRSNISLPFNILATLIQVYVFPYIPSCNIAGVRIITLTPKFLNAVVIRTFARGEEDAAYGNT